MNPPRFSVKATNLTLLPTALLVLACGDPGADAPPDGAAPTVQEEAVDPELGRLDRADVVLDLSWVSGPINRDPDPGAESTVLTAVEFGREATWDRTVFRFDGGRVPGYRVVYGDSALAPCGPPPDPATSGRTLVVQLRAAGTGDAGGPGLAEREHAPGLTTLSEARLVCQRSDTLFWSLALADSAQVRTIEMRNPPRLVVDVAHPAGG